MNTTATLRQKYLEIEIPYKLNVLYSFIYWTSISENYDRGLLKLMINSNAIYCSLYESSILFGRHILSFFKLSMDSDGQFVNCRGRSGDLNIKDVLAECKIIDPSDELLIKNSESIMYLLKVANKRVAHSTWEAEHLGKTDVELIINAQESIHAIVENYVPDLNKELLLKYNGYAKMTT